MTPEFARLSGLGLQMGIVLILFALGGNWLDERLGTSPLFLLVGVFAGAAGSFYSMWKALRSRG